jgi:hypothetical protein
MKEAPGLLPSDPFIQANKEASGRLPDCSSIHSSQQGGFPASGRSFIHSIQRGPCTLTSPHGGGPPSRSPSCSASAAPFRGAPWGRPARRSAARSAPCQPGSCAPRPCSWRCAPPEASSPRSPARSTGWIGPRGSTSLSSVPGRANIHRAGLCCKAVRRKATCMATCRYDIYLQGVEDLCASQVFGQTMCSGMSFSSFSMQ